MNKPVKKPVKKLVKDMPQVKIYVDQKTLKAVKKYIKLTGVKQNALFIMAVKKYLDSCQLSGELPA